ncbi:MAG: glycerol kinase [Thiobacillus sp. 63-78]|uniref:glycerol kinase GlpK n=1 Tax=Thiobacillus sp. 63-78 TaxID=1895859 RepID=UPI00096476FA|nr:glycerol kinase GlpK [Thiobacillus sp. 63-78]MBN8761801.1 glycerol kinase GlpK [Thiobacillus sp.]MBN8772968.1 glycerol kinase GlpK [Thiobacillus sp.]OJZ06618.1 MAG: glycerol kinase [Thiobacillus sp. 63-78]
MQYVLALDQGTTSSRAIVFDHAGQIQSVAQKEFRQIFPRPGWVEHDPDEIWSTQLGVAVEAVTQAGLTGRDIAAIGLANQRETTVVWDRRTGQPVYHAIVWQDRRTAGLCDELRAAGHEALFQRKTGLLLDAYLAGTKLRWILDNVPDARRRAEAGELAFGTIDSWLLWKLSDGALHVTDATNASRTLLFDIAQQAWDDELLACLRVPRAMLPEVRDSSTVYGHTTCLPGGRRIPVAGVAGDQHAALFGQACLRRGMVKNTYGTGCFMLMNTGDTPVPSHNRLLTTTAWRFAGRPSYALEGSIFIAGAVVQWLRDGLGILRSASEVESLAASVPDNGGVYLVPAFVGLGAPHWDPYARGAIHGITRGTTAGHLARAALESIAYQVSDLVSAMQADCGLALGELRVDGGATANDTLMQFQADLLGVPVLRPAVTETTALGAAYLAGLAVGYWGGLDEIAAQWQVERVFEPAMGRDRVAGLRGNWARAVERSRGWAEP